MALIDKIQQNLATAGSQPIGTTDQTARARTLLAAKSGKALPSAASAPQSAVAESVANDQTNQQMEALRPQGQLAVAGLQQQQQQLGAQEAGARADLDLRRQQSQQQNAIRKQQLFADAAREGRRLDFDRDAAKLEQMAHTLRLSDKKYVDTLESEGARQRLDSDIGFREALQKATLGSNADLLKKALNNNDILAADDRQFTEAMARIDINSALQMANNAASDAKQAAMISGLGSMATGAAGAYGTYAEKNPTTTAHPTESAATTTAGASGEGSATKYANMG